MIFIYYILSYEKFIKTGEVMRSQSDEEWIDILKRARDNGVLFQRVRFIDEPISDYVRYEIVTGYKYSISAGEEIRILNISLDNINSNIPLKDFWLFDEEICVLIKYGDFGEFLNLELVDNKLVYKYVELKKKLLFNSDKIQDTNYWKYVD